MEDKITRNELLVLINYMFEYEQILNQAVGNETSKLLDKMLEFDRKNDNINQYPLIEILLYLCTIDETIEQSNKKQLKVKKFFEVGKEDLLCKKLIINSISTAIKHSKNKKIEKLIQNSKFIDTLFFYFKLYTGEQLNFETRYSIAQIKEIQNESLQALEIIADKFQEYFFIEDRIILFLKYLRNSSDNQKLLNILKVFENLSMKDKDKKKIIAKKGTIDLLLYYINGCQRLKNLEDEDIIKIKTYCFSILANLCQDSTENQFTFSQKGGIDIIIENLKNNLLMKTERSSLYVIKLFKSLNCCVLGNQYNEESFLENEGVYILIDFLEGCLKMHYKQILSSLCFLMQNPNSHRYFDDWTSQKTNINSTQLLIQIYKLQDEKFKVQYDKGVLQNVDQPLNPQQKEKKKGLKNLKNALESQKDSNKLIKLIENQNNTDFNIEAYLIQNLKEKIQNIDLRGQIYCILSLTGFNSNELNQEEKQIIEIIKRYQSLKIGEIWKNIKQKLIEKNMDIPEEDYAQIESKVEEMNEILNICLKNQKFLQAEKIEQQKQDLNDFFDLIRNHKK